MPLESRRASTYLLAFDNTGGIATGVAVNSVSSQPLTVSVGDSRRHRSADRHWLPSFWPPTVTARLCSPSQFPVTASIRGTVEFDTPLGGQVSALGIRASSVHTFTTLPTISEVDTGYATVRPRLSGRFLGPVDFVASCFIRD